MDAAGVEVWIETQREGAQVIIAPFARSLLDRQVTFRLHASCRSGSSRSSVAQQGQIRLAAGRGTALARMSLGGAGCTECKLEIALRSGDEDVGVHRFDLNLAD
ncbi:curli-like amyloid fiber formation chaperone CsgH [Noviherbaspirillum aridicola]|uniref:Uncharacterized protein n=1 Tax=Noviherbaspirillum aridicola TaxID=2849687 RepID=A0ABQ4Q767_9BURK|nr:curli-like amyloid fiber formation chaperone CsgH [Noviherbaspirillum aridicola]GIZ52993.1 hypothetical protein NCCP691_30070 [Noviherbaspirillum aridicola]